MGRRSPDPEKEKQWRDILARFKASGLSMRPFCVREGISANTFQYWKRELRDRDEAKSTGSGTAWQQKIDAWKEIIEKAKRNPKGVLAYCRQNKIASQTLYEWFRRIKKHDPSWSPPSVVVGTETESQMFVPVNVIHASTSQVKVKTVENTKEANVSPVNLKAAKATQPNKAMQATQPLKEKRELKAIELTLASGTTLSFPVDIDPTNLVRFIRALEAGIEC